MDIKILIVLIIILVIYGKLYYDDRNMIKIKENYIDMALKTQDIVLPGTPSSKLRKDFKKYNLNDLKKKYNTEETYIGYYDNFLEFDYENLVNELLEEFISYTDYIYLYKKQYNNVFNMFIDLGNEDNPLQFIITDSITSSDIYTQIYNEEIEVKKGIKFDLKNINFVSQIDYVFLFSIINTNNFSIKSEEDLTVFGFIDNYMCRSIAEDIKDYYKIQYKKTIEINYFTTYDSLYKNLNSEDLDCIIIIDRLKSTYLERLFNKYVNFMIFEININIQVKDETNLNLSSHYTPTYLNLNVIKGYLPRKFLDISYTTYNSKIKIYAIGLYLFCNINVNPINTYILAAYINQKFKADINLFNPNLNPFIGDGPLEYDVDSKDIYKKLNFNQISFHRYFLNHSGLNKYLDDIGIINYYPSEVCPDVWGKCTDDLAKLGEKLLLRQ